MTRYLAAALAALLALAALAACKPETAGTPCDRPGAVRVEHPDPSTTDRFRCVKDPDGQAAHWAAIR